MSKLRVYMACSLDGFTAGPEHDLAWLEENYGRPGDPEPDAGALRFDAFLSQVGALLMGRTTYDVVGGMDVWPYQDRPVVVATSRPLSFARPTVESASGKIEALVERAKTLAAGKDVYIDGGNLIRQALEASLVDEITLTIVPVLLGQGTRLFDTQSLRTKLHFVAHHTFENGLVQIRADVRRF